MIFNLYRNRWTQSEEYMEKLFIEMLRRQALNFGDVRLRGLYYRQVRIPEVKRISDVIVRVGDKRLINVEFKLTDWKHVLRQAKDHLKWADYSYICMPAAVLEILPNDFIQKVIEAKLGLMIMTPNTMVEIVRGKHNTYKAGKSKKIRNIVLERIKAMNQS